MMLLRVCVQLFTTQYTLFIEFCLKYFMYVQCTLVWSFYLYIGCVGKIQKNYNKLNWKRRLNVDVLNCHRIMKIAILCTSAIRLHKCITHRERMYTRLHFHIYINNDVFCNALSAKKAKVVNSTWMVLHYMKFTIQKYFM